MSSWEDDQYVLTSGKSRSFKKPINRKRSKTLKSTKTFSALHNTASSFKNTKDLMGFWLTFTLKAGLHNTICRPDLSACQYRSASCTRILTADSCKWKSARFRKTVAVQQILLCWADILKEDATSIKIHRIGCQIHVRFTIRYCPADKSSRPVADKT